MRTSWVAAVGGVAATGLLGLVPPLPPPVEPGPSPYASVWASPEGDICVVFESSQVGSRRDPRPWWQQQWERLVRPIHPQPEWLHGGIL